ncbi:hypothetical protein EMG79_05130, partial [Klebsiella pneumoniae]
QLAQANILSVDTDDDGMLVEQLADLDRHARERSGSGGEVYHRRFHYGRYAHEARRFDRPRGSGYSGVHRIPTIQLGDHGAGYRPDGRGRLVHGRARHLDREAGRDDRA